MNESALRVVARDYGFEDVCVADPLDATERLLSLEAVDDGLNGCVRRSAGLWKRLLDFANGACAFLPERLQHL